MTGEQGFVSQKGQRFFSSPQYLELHRGQLGIHFLSLEVKLQGRKLTSHTHPL